MQLSGIRKITESTNAGYSSADKRRRWFPILGAATCGISAVFLWTASGAINLVGEYETMTSGCNGQDSWVCESKSHLYIIVDVQWVQSSRFKTLEGSLVVLSRSVWISIRTMPAECQTVGDCIKLVILLYDVAYKNNMQQPILPSSQLCPLDCHWQLQFLAHHRLNAAMEHTLSNIASNPGTRNSQAWRVFCR